jgi:hypothetical protein
MTTKRDDSLDSLYRIHRDYIQHEDTLVNQRTTWLITIQAFLIATFGFSYQKLFEVAEKMNGRDTPVAVDQLGPIASEYKTFLAALAIVGVVTSFAAFFSIIAARRAVGAIAKNWETVPRRGGSDYLPGITGGGAGWNVFLGSVIAIGTPLFFASMWLYAIKSVVFEFEVNGFLR